jgi:hypothetical protein
MASEFMLSRLHVYVSLPSLCWHIPSYCTCASLGCWRADTCASEPHDAAEDSLDAAVHSHHRQLEAGHAHEPKDQKGAHNTAMDANIAK